MLLTCIAASYRCMAKLVVPNSLSVAVLQVLLLPVVGVAAEACMRAPVLIPV